MSVAETWQAPDWFASSTTARAGLRILIVDGTTADERCLLQAARTAGIDCPWGHWSEGGTGTAALLFEVRSGLPVALSCLRALRADPHFATLPALLSISPEQLPQLSSNTGFDDFVLQPCTPLEVRTRIRLIERRRASIGEPLDASLDGPLGACSADDGIDVDAVSHEARVRGCTLRLTAREFALFAYLRARPGRVLSRQQLLEGVWGQRYRGGPRSVDTHIGRLRLKFGAALPIETVRGNGYRLRIDLLVAARLDAQPPSAGPRPPQESPAQAAPVNELPVNESAAE